MIRILIADDEVIERKYLHSVFAKHPQTYTVVGEARNGAEILEQTVRTNPDVIIMDISMPCMDGLTSAQRIKRHYPNIIILLNTAYAEFEFARKAVEYQLDAYLLKPAKESLILETIDKCIRQKRFCAEYPSPHIASVAKQNPQSAVDPIALVTDFIDSNSHLPLSLDELSRIAHFTPSYLSRVFHAKKGLTVTAYITRKRLDNAKYLLINSTMGVQELASQCGFSSTPHFNRVFKQHTGVSPLEFRHQNK